MTATINGQQRKSLLVASQYYDDVSVRFIFAGDIDGDGILDLILDTSTAYKISRPTVYLSKPAENGEIVTPVGTHEVSGGGC